MTETMPQRTFSILNAASYVILVAVGIPLLGSAFSQNTPDKWLLTGLFLTLVLLMVLLERGIWKETPLMNNAYMALQTALVTAISLLQPDYTDAIVLFFMLSAQATSFFMWRTGLIWVGIFTVISGIGLYFGHGINSLSSLPIFAAGYIFFAAFANQTREAIETKNESQRLYDELEAAHEQLRLYADQVEELAIVEERNRLAREMHDTVGHRLTVSAVQLEAAQRLVSDNPERAAGMIGTVREQVNEALAELRQTVAVLRAPLEEDLSLRSSLQRLVAQFQEGTGIRVELELPAEMPELPPSHRKALYRAAQESLTNVQRHANAQHVWVQLQQQEDAMALYVSDDGIGVPPNLEASGFGLRGLRERATQLGGDFHLAPRPGGGSQATFHVPLSTKHQ